MELCFACKKMQPVKSYERKYKDGIRLEHYCLACYEKRFISVKPDLPGDPAYTVCPYCGASVEDLKKTALVGCPNCYHTLRAAAVPMVVRMQQGQADAHCGKVSENVQPKARAERRLQEANALWEHYKDAGNAEYSARYEHTSNQLKEQIKKGEYNGV